MLEVASSLPDAPISPARGDTPKESFRLFEANGLQDVVQERAYFFFNESDLSMEPISWKDLAAKLETTVQSLHRWRQLDDAPTAPDLEAWQAFKALRNLGRDRLTTDLGALKAELLREQIKRERGRNAREAGDVIDREVVETMLVTLGQKLNLLLRLKLEVELGPRMVGKNAAEVCVEGALIVDEIREVVNANLATFETEALDRSHGSNG